MQDQRNLILAIVVSVGILLAFQFWFGVPMEERQAPPDEQATTQLSESGELTPRTRPPSDAPASSAETVVPQAGQAAPIPATRDDALALTPRVPIAPDGGTGRVRGSIALRGAPFDDVVLADYHEDVDPGSANIVLLSPNQAPHPYHANFGWLTDPGVSVALPDTDTVWKADGGTLSPGHPLRLTWDNGAGLTFQRSIEIDDTFMFTITDRVSNDSDVALTLYPFGLVSRADEPETSGFFILHEGPLGVFNEILEEVDYDDLREQPTITAESTGGWIGITDKYWLAALIPDQKDAMTARFNHAITADGRDRFQVDMLLSGRDIAPGDQASVTHYFFAGAKEVSLLDRYEESLGIAKFDLAVDFGWFYFLTKFLFYVIHYLHEMLGNFGLAILGLTVLIKLLFFPLANKSYVAMSKLKKLQPQMMELREKFGDDRQRMNQEMMEMYKREKANPLSGCLPILIQIPVFFALYKVLFVTIEMRHAPFYGWIQDLSAPDPTSLFNLFGLLPFTPPVFLMIGVWPLLMGLTMWLQQKLNPAPPDPMQARIMMALPIVFTFLFASFPAGLVIYWCWNNVLSILQQWVIMRRMGVKA